MFGFFKKNKVQYHSEHRWMKLQDDYSVDVDSIVVNRESKILEVLLCSPTNLGLDLGLCRIYFDHSKQGQGVILEEAQLCFTDGKYYNRNTQPQYINFEQNSSIGIIYNKYQKEFGSQLPYTFSDRWLVIQTEKAVYLLDANSISWNNDVMQAVMRVPRTDNIDDQTIFYYDIKQNKFRIVEEAGFQNNVRVFTEYYDTFDTPNDVVQLLCDVIRKNENLLRDPSWRKENAKSLDELMSNN